METTLLIVIAALLAANIVIFFNRRLTIEDYHKFIDIYVNGDIDGTAIRFGRWLLKNATPVAKQDGLEWEYNSEYFSTQAIYRLYQYLHESGEKKIKVEYSNKTSKALPFTCDKCGCHPAAIYTTDKGMLCSKCVWE